VAELLITAPRIVTCAGGGLGVLEDAAILVADGQVLRVGPRNEFLAEEAERRIDHKGLVTPGLVDAHTHAAWVGSRGREYALRMSGADYEAIAAAGGGIVASMRAIRAASPERVGEVLAARLARMAALGVTTVEVKSGYGLDEVSERKQLAAIAAAAARSDLPRVVPTFLGLHAVAPGRDRDDHARDCLGWLEGIARDGLARYVDAYVDRSAFSVAQARPVLERARALGLGLRVHVGQFADVGGAEMAAALGAASVDHLEHVGTEGVRLLAEAGVAATLLPVASFTLGQAPPDVARLRAAGVSLVVASDANPGTAPTESLPLAMAMAVRSYGLTVEETILGATRNAARSLGSAAGVVEPGAPADLVLWDLEREEELVQPWGSPRTERVFRGGVIIA
jgi:imidazolonepropionase